MGVVVVVAAVAALVAVTVSRGCTFAHQAGKPATRVGVLRAEDAGSANSHLAAGKTRPFKKGGKSVGQFS